MSRPARFSHSRALRHGWTLVTIPRNTANIPQCCPLNLDHGPPVKIESTVYIPPPRGWDSFVNVVESIFVVRHSFDLPSHAINVTPSDTSCNTSIVTPSDNKGWTIALDPEDWEDVGYGTIYFDAVAAIPILDYTFSKHAIMRDLGVDMRRRGSRV